MVTNSFFVRQPSKPPERRGARERYAEQRDGNHRDLTHLFGAIGESTSPRRRVPTAASAALRVASTFAAALTATFAAAAVTTAIATIATAIATIATTIAATIATTIAAAATTIAAVTDTDAGVWSSSVAIRARAGLITVAVVAVAVGAGRGRRRRQWRRRVHNSLQRRHDRHNIPKGDGGQDEQCQREVDPRVREFPSAEPHSFVRPRPWRAGRAEQLRSARRECSDHEATQRNKLEVEWVPVWAASATAATATAAATTATAALFWCVLEKQRNPKGGNATAGQHE